MANRALSRREFLQLAASATAAAGLAACAPTATPTAAPTSAGAVGPTLPPAPVAKNIEFWGVSSAAIEERLAQKKDAWREATGITVDYVRAPNGWTDQLQRVNTAIAAGSVPDLIHIKDVDMLDYAWRGGLLGLDDYFASSGIDSAKFRQSVWPAMHYKEKLFAVPWKGSFVWVMFVNDDLMEQAGLDPATDAPTTWEELISVGQQLTNAEAGQYGYTFYELGTREINLALFSALVGQAGGRIFSEDLTQLTLDTPEAAEAMQHMYDLLWTHKIAIPPEVIDSRFDLVKSGVVGAWHIGPWFISDATANAPQLRYSMHPVPCHTTCDNLDTPETIVIPKDAKDPDASWAAIQDLLLKPEVDLELSTIDGFLPAFTGNLDQLGSAASANNDLWARYAEIGKGTNLRPRQWTEGYAEMVAVVGPELQAVWFNQTSVADGLAAAQAAGSEALARARGS